jgi:MYXO-CTERM domain-containing protein
MKLTITVTGALLLAPAVASAEHPMRDVMVDGYAQSYGFVTDAQPDPSGRMFARQVIPAGTAGTTTSALAQSRIIYLNHTGVTLRPGNNDSRNNFSTIVSQQVSIPAWNPGGTVWNDTVSCFTEIFSRFDVQVVTTDPGNVPHIEAVFGGTPTQVGLPSNVGGVSPFTTDCSIIENSIVFTFSAVLPNDARLNCEIMAQEVAHSYGLDHELLASDPMTYLNYNGNREFQNQAVSCGESTPRNCGINGSTCRTNQNSVQLLSDRVGIGDAIAPALNWTAPANNATVPPGFQVNATATDNVAVMYAKLSLDGGEPVQATGAGPYLFATPSDLAEGTHTIQIEISDGKNTKSEMRTVTVAKGADPNPNGSNDPGTGGTPGTPNDVVGGCSTGGSPGLLLGLGFGLFAFARRRRS